ncbi:hypothetical protein R1flu_017692 [Riccia fluitans]|uniref:FAD-binding FR-type domain-containing protein n=1 Tax=Riccia fluitans TaxID=41844 RepID=A0ABD1ZHQ0_9MARC
MGNSNENGGEVKPKNISYEDSEKLILRWTLWSILCFIVLLYVTSLIVMPTQFGRTLLLYWVASTTSDIWGMSGSIILVFAGPLLLLVFGAVAYLYFFPKSIRSGEPRRKGARSSLGTHPAIVSGPLGVVTTAEALWISGFLILVSWMILVYLFYDFRTLPEEFPDASTTFLWIKRVKRLGGRLGFVGVICLGLLFIPVSRGSVLLRITDIPFEHAAKYHVWLGHFTMVLFTLHGLLFLGPWYFEGRLVEMMLSWKVHEIGVIPGEIALGAGLLMWITSFKYTRVRAFELFYYTHHLYTVFIIFMALHVGDFVFGIAFAGIFLFIFDRFLRFCQSRKAVGVLSATLLPCGAFELVLPKPSGLAYNELSFIFLNVPSLSRLQWHPFSVSSSPGDCPHSMKFLIKPLGTWTSKLGNAVKQSTITRCPLALTARVEGPYGHESSYFLDYEALLLVAGGIGVSPFVALIRDLLYRYKNNEPGLPHDVTLVWAVKSHKELRVLDSLHPNSIYPDYAGQLTLNVKAYVTQELLEDLEEGEDEIRLTHIPTEYDSSAEQKAMSHLAGSGNILWIGAAIAASLMGYVVLSGLVGYFYLLPKDNGSYRVVPWWTRGLMILAEMVAGVVVFGGIVILMWHHFESTSRKVGSQIERKTGEEKSLTEPLLNSESPENHPSINSVQRLVHRSNTVYGFRPDLYDLFDSCGKRLSGNNIGVLVCGPEGMQSSVAEQCRAFNTILRHRHRTVFHYHSVSFDL